MCNELVDGIEVLHVYKRCVALARGYASSYPSEELFKVEPLKAACLDLFQVFIYLAHLFENSVRAFNPHGIRHPFKIEFLNSNYRVVDVLVFIEAAVDTALVS